MNHYKKKESLWQKKPRSKQRQSRKPLLLPERRKRKGKSFLETMREIDAKEQQQEEAREAAMQAQLAEQETRKRSL